MLPIRSNLSSYVVGGLVVVLGWFVLVLPSFIMAATADDPLSPTDPPVLTAGAICGLPLVAIGAVLTQKRYRLTLYLTVLTGTVYIATPLLRTNALFVLIYTPAAVAFSIVIFALLFVATVRLSS